MAEMTQLENATRTWGPPILAALVAGLTGVIIASQRQAVTETNVANLKLESTAMAQRIADIDSHGSRQVVSMEGRIKAIEDRNIEQDRRLGVVDSSMASLMARFIIVEDRLASCQGCHMGGGAATLQDHMRKQQGGK